MKINWNRKGMAQILLMPALLTEIDKHTQRIAAASGEGYYPHTNPGRKRHRGAVVAGSSRAARDNRKNNTLLRNMTAGT